MDKGRGPLFSGRHVIVALQSQQHGGISNSESIDASPWVFPSKSRRSELSTRHDSLKADLRKVRAESSRITESLSTAVRVALDHHEADEASPGEKRFCSNNVYTLVAQRPFLVSIVFVGFV